MLKKYLINAPFMISLTTDERWMLSLCISISTDGSLYIGEDALIEWSGWGDQKVKKVRKSLEQKGFLLVAETQPNGKKIYQISESKIIESIVKKKNTGVKITPHRGENHTGTGVKITPLNNINKYNNINRGYNNKLERHPTPLEDILNYRSPNVFVLSDEERKKSAEAMRKERSKSKK